MEFWANVFTSSTLQLSLCLVPFGLAIILIATYYFRRLHYTLAPSAGERWGRTIWMVLLLPIPLLIVHGVIGEFVVTPYQRDRTRAAADALVSALESYHDHTGSYPTALEQLVPAELSEVPTLLGSQPYYYQSDGQTYQVNYGLPGVYAPVACRYYPGSLGWYCD